MLFAIAKLVLLLNFIWLIAFTTTYAQNSNPWIFKKETKGIKIYYRESTESSLYELKLETFIEGSLSAAVAIINDAPHFSDWVYRCKEGKILKRFSETDYIYYNLTDFPWPMDDREFVVNATTEQDPETLTVYTKSWGAKNSKDILPINKDYIRVEEVISEWTFTPLENGEMRAEYYLKSDPGGFIPAWMINMGLDIGPIKSLTIFKNLIQSKRYRDIELPYIQEP